MSCMSYIHVLQAVFIHEVESQSWTLLFGMFLKCQEMQFGVGMGEEDASQDEHSFQQAGNKQRCPKEIPSLHGFICTT